MRMVTLMSILFSLVHCKESTKKLSNPKVISDGLKDNVRKDDLKLIEILSSNNLSYTSVLVNQDSVYFITRDPYHDKNHCSVEIFFYNASDNKFIDKKISDWIRYENVHERLIKSNHPAVYVKSIGELKIEYAKLPNELKKEKVLKPIKNPGTKIQLYNGKYCFLDRLGPKVLYCYDPKIGKTTLFNIPLGLMDVTGFFT